MSSTQDAKSRESAYIAKVEARLKESREWGGIGRFDSVGKIQAELKAPPEAIKEKGLPSGLGVRASIEKKKLLGLLKEPVLTLETRVLSNYKGFYWNGFDTNEIPFAEMMRHVEEAAAKAKAVPYVLGLAATTHWGKQAVDYATEGKCPPNMCLVLIGLQNNMTYYNPQDETLKKVVPYLEAK